MKRFVRFVPIALAGLLPQGLGACYFEDPGSVHFYGLKWERKQGIDFGRAPMEMMMPGSNNEPQRSGTTYDFETSDAVTERDPEPGLSDYWSPSPSWSQHDDEEQAQLRHARNVEVDQGIAKALPLYAALDKSRRTASFVQDRRELLNAGINDSAPGVADYLRATYILAFRDEEGHRAAKLFAAIKPDRKLEPFLAYARIETSEASDLEQAKAYLAVADRFPQSTRAEVALVMAGRKYLEKAFAEKIEAKPDAKQVRDGMGAFDRLLREHPSTRFRWSIYGWRAACDLGDGHVSAAYDNYLKQSRSPDAYQAYRGEVGLSLLATKQNRRGAAAVRWLAARAKDVRVELKKGASQQVNRLVEGMGNEDSKKLKVRVAADPGLLASYLSYRLEDTKLKPSDERRLYRFAIGSMQRFRHRPAVLAARIAQLAYNCGDYETALLAANMAKGSNKDAVGRAQYVKGSALARLGQFHTAARTYRQLIDTRPAFYLKRSAQEALATLEEQHGDPVTAFQIYRSIRFDNDVAFVADSVLTIEQFKRAIKNIRGEERATMDYALAMRYFRVERYREAEAILAKLPPSVRFKKGQSDTDWRSNWRDSAEPDSGSIGPPKPPDVLEDVRTMSRLRAKVEGNGGPEARSAALYELAQHVYDKRNLLFYSAGLWHSERATQYTVFWNEADNMGMATRQAVRSGHEHECYSQALRLCEELIRRFPRTKSVPQALYTAGVCCERFATMNEWWSDHSLPERKKAAKYLRRLVREYPNDPLAKPAAKFAKVFAYLTSPDFTREY